MLSKGTITTRLRRGWTQKDAETIPPFGKTIGYKLAALGINRNTYYGRLSRGKSPEAAMAGDDVNRVLRLWRR